MFAGLTKAEKVKLAKEAKTLKDVKQMRAMSRQLGKTTKALGKGLKSRVPAMAKALSPKAATAAKVGTAAGLGAVAGTAAIGAAAIRSQAKKHTKDVKAQVKSGESLHSTRQKLMQRIKTEKDPKKKKRMQDFLRRSLNE